MRPATGSAGPNRRRAEVFAKANDKSSPDWQVEPVEVTLEVLPGNNNHFPALRRLALAILGLLIAAVLAGVWYRFGGWGMLSTASVRGQLRGLGASARDVTSTAATIQWHTDQNLTSQVEYGATTDYGLLSAFSSALVSAHSVQLIGLTPGRTYHYAVLSADTHGQISRSGDFSFTSRRAPGSPVLSKMLAAETGPTSATIIWRTDVPATSQVEYGTTNTHRSLSVFSDAMTTTHSVTLTGLIPGTNYNAAALSTNAAGQVGKSEDFSFASTGAAGVPTIGLATVSGITTNSATVSWATDQPSSSQVACGPTTSYGSLSAYYSAELTTHSVTLSGLIPGRGYNCIAMSVNSRGLVGKSANLTFATENAAASPVITGINASDVTEESATITWSTDRPSTSQVEYGTTGPQGLLSAFFAPPVTFHSVTLSSLKPGTTYRLAAVSIGSAGATGRSATITLTTTQHGYRNQ
jgi:hypothetical protein